MSGANPVRSAMLVTREQATQNVSYNVGLRAGLWNRSWLVNKPYSGRRLQLATSVGALRWRGDERVSFRVENIIIETDMVWVVKCKIEILQYFCEPEALGFVNSSGGLVVDVLDPRETCGGVEIRFEALDSAPGAIQIGWVSGHTPRIEVAFQDLWALNIIRTGNVVSVLEIKLLLICRHAVNTSGISTIR